MLATLVTFLERSVAVASHPESAQHISFHRAGYLTPRSMCIVTLETERRPYATLYEGGELVLRLATRYVPAEALFNGSIGAGPVPCGGPRTLRVRRHERSKRVKLECSRK